MKRLLSLSFILFVLVPGVFARIWLPSILSDNMVLQQKSRTTIRGWTTNAGETIIVTGYWNNQPVKTQAYQGVWSVKLFTPEAGGPYEVTIRGHEKIVLHNVMIGEVWIYSGQSNMERTPFYYVQIAPFNYNKQGGWLPLLSGMHG